jgi:hypothetical protein
MALADKLPISGTGTLGNLGDYVKHHEEWHPYRD